jgi:hypothetical protein
MKKLIGRTALWLSDALKPVIIWGAGLTKDPKAPWRYVVGGFSMHREFAVEFAEKRLKG